MNVLVVEGGLMQVFDIMDALVLKPKPVVAYELHWFQRSTGSMAARTALPIRSAAARAGSAST